MSSTKAIITLPSASLRKRSTKVGLIDGKVKEIIENMKAVTLEWEDSRKHEVGVALAAIQIDTPLRIVIIRNNFENKADRGFQVFINPQITKYEGTVEEDFEGCLSIKDIYGKVPRHNKVRIKALGQDGKEVRMRAEGFLARIFQHEIDHTNGKMFIDHIKSKKEAFYKLTSEGNLEKLDYGKEIRKNSLLWE